VFAIEFVAMTVSLGDIGCAVSAESGGIPLDLAGPGAQAHSAAHFVHAQEFAQFVDHPVGGLRVKFRAVRAGEAGDIAGIFNRRALHAQANAEKWNFAASRVLNRVDHSLDSAFAESA